MDWALAYFVCLGVTLDRRLGSWATEGYALLPLLKDEEGFFRVGLDGTAGYKRNASPILLKDDAASQYAYYLTTPH